MDDKQIAQFKEQLRLRKLGVAMYELQTILGQKISLEEQKQRANKYYQTIDNAVKQEKMVLDLMYKITGQKIEVQEYVAPIHVQPVPIRKNQSILNQQLQTNPVQNIPKTQDLPKQNISEPTQPTTFPVTSYLSIKDIQENEEEKLLKQGREKPVSNTIFVVKQISVTEATLETHKDMKSNFFNSFYRSLPELVFALEVIGDPSFEDNAVETVEKGKLIKQENQWKIEQKAKIKFKKEEE